MNKKAPLPDHGAVLLVDDHDMIRKLVVRVLEGAGLKVMAVDNGLAAIDLVQQPAHGIGCVIQDLSMPTMRGEEVIRRMHEFVPNLPIIAFSAEDEDSAAIRLTGLNVAGYIQKPFQIDVMIEMILRLTATKPE